MEELEQSLQDSSTIGKGIEKKCFIVGQCNRLANLDGLNESHQVRPGAIFGEIHEKIARFYLRSQFSIL